MVYEFVRCDILNISFRFMCAINEYKLNVKIGTENTCTYFGVCFSALLNPLFDSGKIFEYLGCQPSKRASRGDIICHTQQID
jgi:hypothetical protein